MSGNSGREEPVAGLATVVIPVRNESSSIESTLSSVVEQTYPDLEILVIDGASADGTYQQVEQLSRRDPRIRLISNPGRTIPKALNLALEHARGEWLVRVDGHSTVSADYVATAVELLLEGWGGVGGRKNAVAGPPSGAAIGAVLSSPWGVGGSTYHYVDRATEADHIPFGAYPVEVARAVGGWDERLVANEDFEFDTRIRKSGARLLLDPRLSIDWRCRSRIVDLARQYFRYGRGKADVAYLHPEHLKLRHIALLLLTAGLALALGASIVTKKPLLALTGAYAASVSVASVAIARDLPDPGQRLRVPAVLASMQLAWGLGFWRGIIRLLSNGWKLPTVNDETAARWDSPDWIRS